MCESGFRSHAQRQLSPSPQLEPPWAHWRSGLWGGEGSHTQRARADSLSQEVELENCSVRDLPSSMVLPTGRITLRMTVSPPSRTTDPRGTCRTHGLPTQAHKLRLEIRTELKSATSPSQGERPSFQLAGLIQSVLGRQ